MGVDEDTFVRLYEEVYPRVLAFARRRVPVEQAHDVVDEAFLVAWRKRAKLPPDSVVPWLFVTVRNILANEQRRSRNQDVVVAEVGRRLAGENMTIAAESLAVERMTVLSALSELTEREREALMLTVWDGLTARDAAQVAGCSAVAFAVRLHRARRRFSNALTRQDWRSTRCHRSEDDHTLASEEEVVG